MPHFISPPMLFSPTVSSAVCSCLLCALLYNLPCKLLLQGAELRTGKFSFPPLSLSSISLKISCHFLTRSQTFPAVAWLWTSPENFPEDREAEMRTAAQTASTSHEQQPDQHPGDPPHDLSQPFIAVFQVAVTSKGQLNNKSKLGTGIYRSCVRLPSLAGPPSQDYKFLEGLPSTGHTAHEFVTATHSSHAYTKWRIR